MDKLRVIQWTTGNVGKLTARAILDDPRLELVGLYAHSPDKAGTDAGPLCGRPETGVKATNDIAALIALGADVVVYTPFTGDVDDVARLLESGTNVISTNLFFHVGGVRGAVKERLEAACRRGGSSLYITGINPGWINSVTTALTAVCRKVDQVAIYESADCASYESPETWNYLGMGQKGATDEVMAAAKTWLVMFRDAVERVGEALGLAFDDVEFYCEYATAAERIDLGWFVMEQGTNAALRAGWRGKAAGRDAVIGQVTWYLTRKLAEGWAIDDDEYHLVVTGEPGVDVRIRFDNPDRAGDGSPWDPTWTTAMPTVNALFQIKAARPGVLTLRDMGLPHAPVGAWEGR
jgi:hypothetical protein